MSLPQYQKLKHSGIHYLGTVPVEWTLKRLGDVVEFAQGKAHEPYIDDDGEYICVNSRFVSTAGRTTKKCNVNLTPAYLNDILMVMSDLPNGRALARAYYVQDQAKYAVNQRVCRITAKEAYSRFLFYLLDRHPGLMQNDDGVNQTHLSSADFQKLRLYLPSISEQTKIAKFLDHETARIDELIEMQQRLVELLKEKRQAVISHAVTKGLNPNVPMKDSGIEWLGEVPGHWKITKLGRLSFMQEGPGLRTWQFTGDGVRVICVTNITEGGIDFSRFEKFISQDEYEKSYRHFTVSNGDVLISSSGNSWGKVAVYLENEPVILNTSTIRLNENAHGDICRDFLALLLQSMNVREQLFMAMTGSCQPNFGPTHLKEVVVGCPPIKEQELLVEFMRAEFASLDALMGEANRGIELLKERRSVLISAAVTGKIDVRTAVSVEAA